MKIIHLTSLHRAHDTRIFHKQCKSLAAHGYDVTLVARSKADSVVDGVRIQAVPTETSRLRRFFLSSWRVYRKARASGSAICHFHDPELIPIAVLLRLGGKKVIYDVHEDLPRQNLSKDWIHPLLRYPVSWLCACAEWIGSRFFFSAVVPATPKIAERFPANKTVVVQNFPILEELQVEKPIPWKEREDAVVYVGGVARIRGALENVRAFEYVRNPDCRFILAGPFSDPGIEQECRALKGWDRVVYHPWLDRKGVREALSRAKTGLVLFHPLPNHINAQPNKLFEYMSAGLPVIASDFSLWRRIVEGSRCGLLVDPMRPEKIAEAIEWLLEHPEEAGEMGRNGRLAVEERYNWGIEEGKLVGVYERLLSTNYTN